jgi:hypothetical protein
MRVKRCLCLAGVLFVVAAAPADARTWTSTRGTTIEADLLTVAPQAVVLKAENGKVHEVPLRSLSGEDQQFVNSLDAPDPSAGLRRWTSTAGTAVTASLVEIKVAVILRSLDGKIHEVPLEALSEADRRYVRSLAKPEPETPDPTPETDEPSPSPISPRPTSPSPTSPSPTITGASMPQRPAGWTMNPDELIAAEGPLGGELLGQSFRFDEAELQEGTLVLRGGGARAGRTIHIHLFPQSGESLAGRTYRMPGAEGLRAPVVKLAWSDGFSEKSETFLGNFALLLEFGEPYRDRLLGKLHLCLPDEQQSFLAGEFAAKILPPGSPAGP